MYYKLSALELELLSKDRRKILRQFQQHQVTRRKSLKPPILVVTQETSGLICIITRDEESSTSSQDGDSLQDGSSNANQSKKVKVQRFCQRFGSFLKTKFTRSNSPPEAKVEDRQIKRHQKRLSTGAATSIQLGTSGGTSGLTEVAGNGSIRKTTSSNLKNGGGGSNNQKSASSSNKSNAQKPKEQHILGEIGPLLGIKCDVCVLSKETQVFRLLDGILESDLWPISDDCDNAKESSSRSKGRNRGRNGDFKGQRNLKDRGGTNERDLDRTHVIEG